MSPERPNPEKLLQRVQEEEKRTRRGKLKIYLGAAPGVGKTHEMLHDALEKISQNVHVMVGVVESHGRKEIESLLEHFDIIPRKTIPYHGKELFEFDLDDALKRHPSLILVDEMAHTNAPSVRHKKRWQDIKELLDRGIDVYTTLNVQHIESLNDDVTQIIHAPIKETIPDSMIELADTLELVDLPPEELLKRLHEGKVYVPEQAELATEHYFQKGNLIALRELALRIMAERVGAQVVLYRQGQSIKHIWPTKDKILVCVGPAPECKKLIRAARRLASSLQIDWIAVVVETPKIQASENAKNNAIKNLQFAESLGATTRVLTGFDIVKEVMEFAREQNVTQIMVWKNIRSRLRTLFFRDLADEMVRHAGEIDIYIMTGEENPEISQAIKKYVISTTPWKTYLVGLGIVILTTGFNFLLFPILDASTLIMMYLLGVVVVALFGEMGPAFITSILSVLAYGFFFIAPYYTFDISDLQYLLTLLVMLLISSTITHLTLRARKQAETAKFAERQTAALHALSRQLASTRGTDKIIEIGTHYIGDMFDCEVHALLPKGDRLILQSQNASIHLSEKELGIAKWVYELGRVAGLGTDTLSFSDALYVPLTASQKTVGVLRILPKPNRLFTPDQMYLLEACTNQIALALEVDKMQEKTWKKQLKLHTNRAQNELIQSVSHDLHTPLVAILGNVSTLIEMADGLSPKKIRAIGNDIYLELEQHNRLINNLLQMTYLESGAVKLQKQPISLPNLVNSVVETVSKKLANRKIIIKIADAIPDVFVDATLLPEVLINLIDNAVKFSPADSRIEISASLENDKVVIGVADEGPGIVPDELDKLFEKYYRGRKITTERGLGLGLAICRAIIKAHNGHIWAENRKEGGAAFKFSLPAYVSNTN